MRRLSLLAAAAAGVLALPACGGSGSGSTVSIPPGAVHVIAEDGLHWNASSYQAKAGDVVIAGTNASALAHNLYVVDANGKKNPTFIDLPNRRTVLKTFKLDAGIYRVVCLVPGHQSMNSTLTVSS
jgi:plastocyanin